MLLFWVTDLNDQLGAPVNGIFTYCNLNGFPLNLRLSGGEFDYCNLNIALLNSLAPAGEFNYCNLNISALPIPD